MDLMKSGNVTRVGRAQSAMEYLMTYGWAILVIAVVLAALFALGVFNGSTLPSACIAQSGFQCKITAFNGIGGLSATVGQATGQTWYNVKMAFLNQTQMAAPSTAAYWAGANAVAPSSSTMYNGALYTITNVPYNGVTG
ncbi:MAG: hypothetical protein M1321_01745, partial [Candidatus Marsarchaeota archaeon]|nr:hypothetical protein [Candidatus Marsarchaeota archaeon]